MSQRPTWAAVSAASTAPQEAALEARAAPSRAPSCHGLKGKMYDRKAIRRRLRSRWPTRWVHPIALMLSVAMVAAPPHVARVTAELHYPAMAPRVRCLEGDAFILRYPVTQSLVHAAPAATSHMARMVDSLLTALVDSLLATLIAACVVISWRLCVRARRLWSTTNPSPQPAAVDPRKAVLTTLREGRPPQLAELLGRMCGGGTSEDRRHARVVTIAEAIRQLGEVVNKPGLKAIEALLMIMDGAADLKDAIKQTNTSAPSVRKYRPLVDKVLNSCTLGATLAAAAAVAGPVAAGVVAGATVAALLPQRSSLSKFSNLRLSRQYTADGQTYCVWLATLRHDDVEHDCQTTPVLHDPPPQAEAPEDRRKREKRNDKRLVDALIALDPEALAAGRTKDRARKRAKAAQRASQMPALPLADDDPAWRLPPADQPHFVGESVWHFSASSDVPQRATIRQLYRDGSAELLTDAGAIIRASPHDRLVRVGLPVPSYVGQRVEIDSGSGVRDLAEITAVHADHTVDVRLFNSSHSYGETRSRLHVASADCLLVPRMFVMRDVAMMLADDALVLAGYPTLADLAAEHGLGQTNRWRLAPLRWLRPQWGLRRSVREDSMQEDNYIPPKLVDWWQGRVPGRPEWPKPGNRPLLRDPQSPQLQRSRGGNWGPLMSLHNGYRRCSCTSLCPEISFGHFIASDHPPDQHGPHPYIVVPEAENAGADMRQARELLGMLELATGFGSSREFISPRGTTAPVPTSFEGWKAYIYSATHRVCEQLHCGNPASEWTALHESRLSGCDDSRLEQAFDAVHECLMRASEANARAVAELQQADGTSTVTEPLFLRIAKRATRGKPCRLRQMTIDWPARRQRYMQSTSRKRQMHAERMQRDSASESETTESDMCADSVDGERSDSEADSE